MAELVSKTYSEALFEVALESDQLAAIKEEFDFLAKTFEANADFFELIKTPKISMTEKKQILSETFSGTFSEAFMNFLKIIVDKRREADLLQIKKAYDERVNAYHNRIDATVESVLPLSAEQMGQLSEKLARISGKEVTLENVINKDLIGGVVVTLGDRVIDGSIKYKLETMLESLTQIII
ncbi:F0F1 ATP synthase subunit delta [Fusibacter sp. JL298sf-3]